MKYDLTIQELLEIIQTELNTLKGKNVVKEGGIGPLIARSIGNITIDGDFLVRYYISVNTCRLEMYCSGLNKDIPFAEIYPTYKPDKRKFSGYGDYLETLTIKLIRNIPLNLSVLDASQFLDYQEAKENFERLEKLSKDLLKDYYSYQEGMQKMQEIMKTEAYDEKTSKEATNALETLQNMSLKF